MELNEIKTYFETNKDTEDVRNYLLELSKVTEEGVNSYIATEEGKKWIGKQNDSFFTKGLETWKTNNLNKLIDEEIKKRFPAKTEQEIELEKMRVELENMKTEKVREARKNKALTIANERKLPVNLVDYFLGADDESTVQNLTKLEEALNTQVTALVEERLKSGYKPPNNSDKLVDISKMSMEEYAKYWDEQNKK